MWLYLKIISHKLTIISSCLSYFEVTCMIQTRSTAGFQTFEIGPFLLSRQRIMKKIHKALKIILLQFLTLSSLVVTKGNTYLNKPVAEICRFVWVFIMCWYHLAWKWVKKKQRYRCIYFSFSDVFLNTKKFCWHGHSMKKCLMFSLRFL